MPLPRVHRVVQDSLGNVVPQVLCSVLLEGTGTLATLWQDDAGTIPLSNPMTSDATYGSFDFYVQPAHYDLTFTKPGYVFQPLLDMQVPQDDLTLGTMAQQDAHNVQITGGTIGGLTDLNSQFVYVPDKPSAAGQKAFIGGVQAGVDRYNLYCTGTAPNFFTGDTQLGLVGIGKVPSVGVQAQVGFNRAGASHGMSIQGTGADTGGLHLIFANAAGTQVGNVFCTATTTAYNTTSDSRLKHAITPLTGALDVVRALNPVAYLWNADGAPGRGLLAGDVQEVIPDGVVTGDRDAVDSKGHILPQMIDYSKLVPYLVGAVKELMQQVEILQAQLAEAGA